MFSLSCTPNAIYQLIIRSHEAMDEGFEVSQSSLVTVFSAPDYCGMKNLGAIMRFEHPGTLSVHQFESVKVVKKGPKVEL